ncbi:MAG TPA: glycosyltransferase [Blastocatellia bacterium]|nr:glycosyltransferase [Blastocatellia bacterium]
MRPKVLELIDSFRVGGSERQAVQTTRLLTQSGRFDVSVACLNNIGPLRSDIDELDLDYVPEYRLNNFYDRNTMTQARRFADYLKSQKIDIVHTHDFYTNIFGMISAAIAQVPVRIASRRESSKRRADKRLLERIAYRWSHRVIANCDEIRRQLVAEGVPAQKIVTVYNGLNLDRLRVRDFDRASALAQFNLPNDGSKRFVTIVANVRPVKDHKTFLRAAQLVRSSVPEAYFVIAGEGELIEEMRQLARELGIGSSTFFIGRCNQVADLLALSEVCVLSSISEGFSNSILEYMAASRPVVATDVGGAREAIIDGETGYLVPAENHSLMAKHITGLLNDRERASEMGRRGRLEVEKKFSCERQLEQVEGLYRQLLEARTFKTRKMEVARHVSDSNLL